MRIGRRNNELAGLKLHVRWPQTRKREYGRIKNLVNGLNIQRSEGNEDVVECKSMD